MEEKNFIAEVAERFREERQRLGLSHEETGTACAVSGRSVISWEQGVKIPSHALAMLSGKGFDVTFILTGERVPNAAKPTEQAQHQVQEQGGEYRVVTPKQAAILDLLNGLGDDALRDVQAVAEKEKLLKELQEGLADIKRKVWNGGA
jgi:transcriptional regulator with XRE-family HTH domain